jgi:hypothetical protein
VVEIVLGGLAEQELSEGLRGMLDRGFKGPKDFKDPKAPITPRGPRSPR